MEQMATSSSSDGDRMAKLSNRQHGPPPAAAQGLPSQPPLNCPRCDSTNTKFCYYNNYSQAQPRHFCKSCRRYWTQGGTLRNVPVGGGCRKNKRVRPRSLMSMGGLDHGPTAFPDATSSMLGRLSSIPNFGNGCDDTSSQLLNIAFARFQESLRPRQQAAQAIEGAPFSDISLPALVHKPCSLSSCGGLMVDGFDHNFGFQALPAEPGYHRSSYEMPNPALYAQTHSLMGTSATAALDSLEDELSSFSNLQFHLNPMNSDVVAQEDKAFTLPACSAPQRLLPRPPLMEHCGSHLSYAGTPLGSASSDLHRENAEDDKAIKDEIKPMIDMTGESRLSLMIPADNNWQQHQHQHHQQQEPSSMNDILFNEPHHAMMWPPNTGRWQDMHTTSVL